MENVKEIVKIGQKLTAHKGECIGIKIYEMKKEVEVSKVNKKSFIASGIKFSLWKVTDKDSCGLRRKDGKKRAIFTSPSRIDGIIEIEF